MQEAAGKNIELKYSLDCRIPLSLNSHAGAEEKSNSFSN